MRDHDERVVHLARFIRQPDSHEVHHGLLCQRETMTIYHMLFVMSKSCILFRVNFFCPIGDCNVSVERS